MAKAAIRYAKAVLSTANDKKNADAVNSDMKLLANTIAENQELNTLLNNSVVKSKTKKEVLLAIFKNLDSASVGLIDLLITNKRLHILNEVAVKYNSLFDESIGKETAKVTTAVPLSNDLEVKVLAKVKELTNKAVALENIIDESILGGFILRVGDKQYDASVSNKLNKLKREFSLN